MIELVGDPEVVARLASWDARRRKADALIWTPRCLLIGLLLGVIVATVARLYPLLTNTEVAAVTAGLASTGFLFGLLISVANRRTLIDNARFADRRFNLSERVSASIEIVSGIIRTSPALAERQIADTLRAMDQADSQEMIRLRFNIQDLVLAATALGLLAAAVLIPNPQADELNQRRAVSNAVSEQIETLEGLVETIASNTTLTEEAREELLTPIESVLNDLSAGNLSQEEAVAVLSEAEAEMRDLVADNSQDALASAFAAVAGPLTENPLTQNLAQALRSGQLATARTAAAQLADNLPQLDDSERLDLANALAEAAAALQEIDAEMAAELAQAAQDLASGRVEEAQEALQNFAADLQQRAGQQAAQQKAATAADQLARSRQEVAQAGSGQGQSGAAGDGQGQANGQGQNGDGAGTGGNGNQGATTDQGSGQGGPGPGGGHAEALFVPDLVDLSAETGVDIELPAECVANPDSCGALIDQMPTKFGDEESMVPYDQVFGDYRDAAYRALDQDVIPLSLKDTVRDYFTSLEP